MSSRTKFYRLWSADLARGALIVLMALGHTVFFVHSGYYDFLGFIRGLADLICFTGLIFLSGIAAYYAYLHFSNDPQSVRSSLTKKLLAYTLGYYLLAITGYLLKFGWSWSGIVDILLFRYFLPFTEFIPTFIIFGLLKIPFKKILAQIAGSLSLTLSLSLLFYCFGVFLYPVAVQPFFEPWKALLIGSSGYYTFPVFFYTPVYLFGIWLGARVYRHSDAFQLTTLKHHFLILSLIFTGTYFTGIITSLPPSNLFHRFPPTPTFLLFGLTAVTGLLFLFQRLRNLRYYPLSQNFLLLFGQNAFSVYWAQTLLLFVYQSLQLPMISSAILTLIFFGLSLLLSLYIAKVVPLNYRYGLEIYDIVEDFKITPQEKTRLHRLNDRLFSKLFNLPRLFSIRLGGRQIKLLSSKIVLTTSILLLLMVTQLGVAEELVINQAIWQDLEGKVDLPWITTLNPRLTYTLTIPPALNLNPQQLSAKYAIDGEIIGPMTAAANQYQALVEAANLSPGKHQLTAYLEINKSQMITQPTVFNLSAPLYVAWTVDWEGYDVPNQYLQAMAQIAATHGLPITHLFNPAIYSSDAISPPRATALTAWVKDRLSRGDDLGLHLHMFPHYIKLTGVDPKLEPAWGGGFSSGYDVLTTAYSREEMKQILTYSLQVFADQGLPIPRTYRAGAWFANLDTLKALQDVGFLADTSGRTRYVFGTNQVPGFWDLQPDTQPYYPSALNQNNPSPAPQLNLLEIPNNGADDFAFSTQDMINRFTANFSGEPLTSPRQITFLSHPQWLNQNRQHQMNTVFTQLHRYSAKQGMGPVIFTTLTGIYEAFK